MFNRVRYFMPATAERLIPNRWDCIAFPLLMVMLILAIMGVHETWAPLSSLTTTPISLSPDVLPEYALRSTLRMLTAMVLSLGFTLVYGTLAAKSRRLGLILIPMLDILQSVPVLGYISFTVTLFLALFPGRVVGAECAALFAIFTGQVWNMTFSFYQSLITVPQDLREVSANLRLSAWQKFWKLEVPFAMPGMIWNMMMSMSAGWFFVVASESITVGNQYINLPGLGSYLAVAIRQQNMAAIGWVILAMIIVIILYDVILFRPLVALADKFRLEDNRGENTPQSWVLNLIHRTRVIQTILHPAAQLIHAIVRLRLGGLSPRRVVTTSRIPNRYIDKAWWLLCVLLALLACVQIVDFLHNEIGWYEVLIVIGLGCLTLIRVCVLLAISSLIWVPIGVWIGLRPKWANRIQPLAQFLAAFPANLFFPVFVIFIVHYHLNADIWLSPLIILGAQWYILFNVIAGAMAFPNDFKEAVSTFRIRGWQWWRSIILPGIFPYYVTGAITASGGAWNASIVSEYASWGSQQVAAHGLGAYIAKYTVLGDYPKILLGVIAMSLFVVLFNRLLWRPLYALAEQKMRLH